MTKGSHEAGSDHEGSDQMVPRNARRRGEGRNLIALKFIAPKEYGSLPETAMYENAIKAAGGYVVERSYQYFTAVFDATKASKNPVFNIRWEDGYVETYTLNLKDAVKLANLEDAVAPKALAFNAANGKMAVGETQQLDVKITKEQMGM